MTPEQLAAKGIYKKDLIRLLAKHEKLVNWYANNDNGTELHRKQWDLSCQHWDETKATLRQFP